MSFWRWLWGSPEPTPLAAGFTERYASFEELLRANTELSRVIADLEVKLQGRQIYGVRYVRAQAGRAVLHTRTMVRSLERLAEVRHPELNTIVDRIERELQEDFGRRGDTVTPGFVLPFDEVSREVVDRVGPKTANLGEARNRAGAPVPDGFAVTTAAFVHFLGSTGLSAEIRAIAVDQADLEQSAARIRELVLATPIPDDLGAEVLAAWDQLADGDLTAAVRSSAVGEDTDLAHSGQYLTVLGVRRDGLLDAWRRVVASLYSPWALSYRLHAGVHDEDLAMGVAVVRMVSPRTSGVAYSRSYEADRAQVATVSAVFGLGTTAVDGTFTPDLYTVGRDGGPVLERRIGTKPYRVEIAPDGGTARIPVPDDQAVAACLTDAEVSALAALAERLEDHFGAPQDIEWAIDPTGKIHLLQTRPLLVSRRPVRTPAPAPAAGEGPALLLDGGAVACPGVGRGPVFQVKAWDDLARFPDGGVLVAKYPSPRVAQVIGRAAAILTDAGSVLGHMASLCREFGVPTLVDTRCATDLEDGAVVTVDASSARVYAGRVTGLDDEDRPYIADTAVGRLLERVAARIVPLRLVDPRSPTFAPASCHTLHDVMRFVHECCYREMFRVGDLTAQAPGGTVQLDAAIGVDLHVIDLGGGLPERAQRRVRPEDVRSIPLAAVLRGMLHPGLQRRSPRLVSVGGFLSVLSEQMLQPPTPGGERFGDRSYAVVSDRYLHFSSRVGYHYSLLDAWCDDQGTKSYVGFSFQGGAAGEVRRARRARAVARVLEELGMVVDARGDRVDARLKRGEQAALVALLDQLGRLLQFTRQLDMLMEDDALVEVVARAFLDGRYDLEGLLR